MKIDVPTPEALPPLQHRHRLQYLLDRRIRKIGFSCRGFIPNCPVAKAGNFVPRRQQRRSHVLNGIAAEKELVNQLRINRFKLRAVVVSSPESFALAHLGALALDGKPGVQPIEFRPDSLNQIQRDHSADFSVVFQ
jgi:hypothetical protein